MNISLLLQILSQLRVDHWRTTSYAQHIALGTAYDNLSDLFDKFVEVYYGRNGIDNRKISPISVLPYEEDLAAAYKKTRDEVRTELTQAAGGCTALENIRDEILAEFNHLLYKFQQS